MSEVPKRFIKKVPPSGAAPVFKLTLSHSFVHSHLSHLIDREFEIATSAHASNCWQGTIAPRRNKNRSEYTLQGWRLFAEAHGVKTGDQVSFELVSANRLVVRVMSTEEAQLISPGLSNATSALHEDQHAAVDSPIRGEGEEPVDAMEPMPGILEQTAERRIEALPEGLAFGSAKSQESSFQGREADDLPKMQMIREFLSTGPAAARPPSFAQQGAGPSHSLASFTHGAEAAKGASESPSQNLPRNDWAFSTPTNIQGRNYSGPPFSRPLEISTLNTTDFSQGGLGSRRDSGSPYSSSTQIQNQLLEMRSTIQAQQASLHFFEAKARRAEYEASQIKLFYSELHVTMNKQTRLVINAGEALESLVGRLSAPELMAATDRATTEHLLALQAELFKQLHNLKSCLLSLLSLDV